MSYSKNALIQRVKDLLDDTPWQTNVSEAIDVSETDISVPNGDRWDEGATGEFADGDTFLVDSVAANVLTVIRGYNGSTATAHLTGDVLTRDPVFRYRVVADTVNAAIRSQWPYLWKKETTEINVDPEAVAWYPLPATSIDLIAVAQDRDATIPDHIEYGPGFGRPVWFRTNLSNDLSSTGVGVKLSPADASAPLQVDCRAKLTDKVVGANYVDLDDTLADCIAYAAASRLVGAKEIPRVTQEDVSMGDASVPPQNRSRTAQLLFANHIQLRNQLQDELRRTIGPMKTWRRT